MFKKNNPKFEVIVGEGKNDKKNTLDFNYLKVVWVNKNMVDKI
jgi:hypothetical protein